MHILAIVVSLWKLYSPWVLLVGIPSVLTAMSKMPRYKGWKSYLIMFASALSFLPHRDQDTVLKMPGWIPSWAIVFAKDVVKEVEDTTKGGPKSPLPPAPLTLVALLLLTSFGLTQSSCCYFSHTCAAGSNPVIQKVVDCAEATTQAAANDLSVVVADVLETQNWKAALDGMATTVGEAALACAVMSVVGSLSKSIPATMPTVSPVTLEQYKVTQTAIQNGQDWLNGHQIVQK